MIGKRGHIEMESKKTDWNLAGLAHLFGRMDKESPLDNPFIIDCERREDLGIIVWEVITAIRSRFLASGFYAEPEICLFVPRDTVPNLLGGIYSIFEYDVHNNVAYLFTIQIGRFPIIHLKDGMTWLDWFNAVLKGEKPCFVNTMPWAHAKFINWKEKDESERTQEAG